MKPAARETGTQRNNELSAFLEQGSELEGNLVFTGVVRINGRFKGAITSHDGLIIGQAAQIEGELKVGSINIGGSVKGNVQASERIEIQSTGRVEGTLVAPAIAIHEGAQIIGELCIRRTDEAGVKVPEAPSQLSQAAH